MSSMFEHTQKLFFRRRPSQRSCPRPTDPRTAMCPREALASGIPRRDSPPAFVASQHSNFN